MNRMWMKVSLGIVAITVLASAAAYAYLPEKMPMHWNVAGEVDGWGPKHVAVPLMPAVMVGLLALFAALPWLSPKKFTLDTFRPTYEFIVFLVMAMCAYIHGLTLFAGWTGRLDISQALIGGACLMFAALGNVLGKVKPNLYVGVRTPWTLASDRVWISTHRLAAKMFVAAGLVGLATCLVVSGKWMVIVLIAAIGSAALIPVIYSLVFYKRLERRGEV